MFGLSRFANKQNEDLRNMATITINRSLNSNFEDLHDDNVAFYKKN